MAQRKYYTLVSKEAGGKWGIEYGSYDREDVLDEIRSYVYYQTIHPLTIFKIITTGYTPRDQVKINKAVALMNRA